MSLGTILIFLIGLAILIMIVNLIHFILRIIELAEDERERF
jgi:hypothetical protein